MGRISRVTSAIISVAISVLTILFLYGYLSPIGLSPSALFGSSYADLFGGTLAGSTLTGTYSPLIPGGVTGLILFTVLSRVGGVARAAMAPSMPSAEEMMRKMNFPGMMPGMMGMQAGAAAPSRELPSDLTKSQFVLLRSYRQGYKNPKEVAKALTMDRKEVESLTSGLVSSGYLTRENKLTSKSLELFV